MSAPAARVDVVRSWITCTCCSRPLLSTVSGLHPVALPQSMHLNREQTWHGITAIGVKAFGLETVAVDADVRFVVRSWAAAAGTHRVADSSARFPAAGDVLGLHSRVHLVHTALSCTTRRVVDRRAQLPVTACAFCFASEQYWSQPPGKVGQGFPIGVHIGREGDPRRFSNDQARSPIRN